MEYEKVFAAIVIVAIGAFASLSLINSYNSAYGTSSGTLFNNSLNQTMVISNVAEISSDMGAGTQNVEGSGTESSATDLSVRALRIITVIPRLLGLVPSMLYTGAFIIGIPDTYVNLVVGIFVFSFVALFAYLLLIGARRLM